MNVKEVIIPYKMSDGLFKLYAGGDEHLGTKHCAEDAIKGYVKKIKEDKFSRWLDVGDKGEFITPKDPRWDYGVIADWVDQEDVAYSIEKRYVGLHEPIKDKCIGLMSGNHEYSFQTHNNEKVHKHICDKLEVDDLGFSTFIKLIFRRRGSKEAHEVKIFATHGAGGAVTKGAKLMKLQRLMDAFEADIYIVGHMHDLITDKKPYLALTSQNIIRSKQKVGAVTGCYFQTYMQDTPPSYGERKNYPPTAIGSVVFSINPSTGEIDVHHA